MRNLLVHLWCTAELGCNGGLGAVTYESACVSGNGSVVYGGPSVRGSAGLCFGVVFIEWRAQLDALLLLVVLRSWVILENGFSHIARLDAL